MKNIYRTVIPSLLPFSLLLTLAAPSQAQKINVADQFESCARTTDKSVRITCYEELRTKVLGEDSVQAEIPQAKKPDTPATPSEPSQEVTKSDLPDTIGGGKFSKKPKKKAKKESFRGLVTSCKKSASNKWFYFFDNGQVWKQVDSDNRYHKKCSFQVTITKDTFGYKMKIDGKRRTIRIKRQKK